MEFFPLFLGFAAGVVVGASLAAGLIMKEVSRRMAEELKERRRHIETCQRHVEFCREMQKHLERSRKQAENDYLGRLV